MTNKSILTGEQLAKLQWCITDLSDQQKLIISGTKWEVTVPLHKWKTNRFEGGVNEVGCDIDSQLTRIAQLSPTYSIDIWRSLECPGLVQHWLRCIHRGRGFVPFDVLVAFCDNTAQHWQALQALAPLLAGATAGPGASTDIGSTAGRAMGTGIGGAVGGGGHAAAAA